MCQWASGSLGICYNHNDCMLLLNLKWISNEVVPNFMWQKAKKRKVEDLGSDDEGPSPKYKGTCTDFVKYKGTCADFMKYKGTCTDFVVSDSVSYSPKQ